VRDRDAPRGGVTPAVDPRERRQTDAVVLFLFLTHLGIGILLSLLCVSREAGVKFFRFNAGLAAILIVVAVALRPPDDMGTAARLAFAALMVSEAAIILYWATVGRMLASIRPAIIGVAGGAGVIAVVAQALAASSETSLGTQVLTVTSFLSSVALLGGTCTAMVLGHWYLILPSLQVHHLQSIVKVHIVSMVVRIAVVTAAVFFAIATWQPGLGPSFSRYILSVDGVFFWQRVLFGLGGPALLSYLTWETAKIRSTQSATGILYVDFFTVVVGEVLAKYLLLATRVPV
jgi:protein NrfD